MKELDCRGLSCPQPVVRTKKAIDSGEQKLVVLVDNETAADNVSRLASQAGYVVNQDCLGSDHKLTLTKSGSDPRGEPSERKDSLILVNSDALGSGSEELGRLLVKTFLHTLNESTELPGTIVFMNSGIKVVTSGSDSLEDLIQLEKRGVELLACGTCLDYFGLKDNVAAGKISNMFEILSRFLAADKVITL